MSKAQDRAAARQAGNSADVAVIDPEDYTPPVFAQITEGVGLSGTIPPEVAALAHPAVQAEAAPKREVKPWETDDLVEDVQPTPAQPAPGMLVQGFDMAQFAAVLAAAITKGNIDSRPVQKVKFAQYDPKNIYHPDRKKAAHLTRACYQNGCLLMESTMFDREIELLNTLTHSGRYINRLVEIYISQDSSEDEVHIRYNNKSADQKLENKGAFPSLLSLLEQVAKAQEQERQEDVLNDRKRAERGGRR